jgi:photosystem II stability/assembly factor-like uncharacterized protein
VRTEQDLDESCFGSQIPVDKLASPQFGFEVTTMNAKPRSLTQMTLASAHRSGTRTPRIFRMSQTAALVIAGVLLSLAAPAAAQRFFMGWTISEFHPDIKNGGRVNTIAVDPANNNVILVASESGGLFRSTNRGVTWHHVDELPEFSTNAVAFVPTNPNIVIVTASEDFKVSNGGGIWRSTDNGVNWSQLPNPAAPPGVTDRFSAWDVSIAPDTGNIYAGTAYGLSMSTDQGATWTLANAFSGGDPRVFAVVAQSGNLLLVGGPAGIRRSTDGGSTWVSPASGNTGIWDMHALGRSPYAQGQAYVVNGTTQLYYTEDSGDHWTQIASAPGGGGSCGGISFVKPISRIVYRKRPFASLRFLDLYFGNRCGLSKLTATPISGTNRFDYSGSWTVLNSDHGDTRDLAFDNSKNPLLLGTDGGLHNTVDGGLSWTFVGGGHAGYNALQITEVRGQWITDIGRHDLYFGTQDNNLWASGDGGATWINSFPWEGFFIERQHRVATSSDSKTTYVACGGCADWVSNPLFSGASRWPEPPNPAANPKIVSNSSHVQAVNDSSSLFKGLAFTANLGASWQQYARFPEDVRDLPKQSRFWFLPVLYQSVRTGWDSADDFEINHLVRIARRFLIPGTLVSYPAMNNFGGLGINPTMFAWYQVFAVDPLDSGHLIAPDIVNQKMMETHDGGDNWTEIPQLTSLTTGGGQFLFRRYMFPHASAVSFSPDDPNTVAVGTWQGGIMLSGDRGATWSKIPGSEQVTYITSFDWRTPSDAIISTYGRGLWRLKWTVIIPWLEFEHLCYLPCLIDPFIDKGDPAEKYTEGILVFNGRVQGARVSQGVLQELLVSPGSSVAFVSDAKEIHNIKITETTKRIGFANVAGLARAPGNDYQTIGFMLGKKGNIRGTVFSQQPLSMLDAQERQSNEERVGSEKSPIADQPYVRITTGRNEAGNAVVAGSRIQLAGKGFRPGTQITIALDGRIVEKVGIAENGEFSVTMPAPQQVGLHRATVRDAETGKVIDGVMFIVRHEDGARSRKVAPKTPSSAKPPK